MHAFAYAEVVEDSEQSARERDGKALDVAIEMLERGAKSGLNSTHAIEALYFSSRLWSAFVEDLSLPENGLEPQLRAALISVGISLLREIERLRDGEATSFRHLIEVSSIVREGLR